MGFLDLSTSVASKKHVDFNDARYQLSDKLKQSSSKNIRATFTLYDNKDVKKTAIQDISAAYALSDKRMPMGELLNKMIDLITDMEDGKLDSEANAIYTWKYSQAILTIFDDKIKRQETLSKFDNSLKAALIGSEIFCKKFPGKYTNRTNFFDKNIKASLLKDIVDTFKEVALPGIHEAAIIQSREIAERHENPTLDKIVQWAIENYHCEVDSFFNVQEDPTSKLFFSTNTIIIHLNNGYDMSIIGYVGTDADDKFAISIFDANSISLDKHGERMSENEIQKAMAEASQKDAVNPLTKLLTEEKKKNEILKQQYDILFEIRPMIPASALELQAAESVVGQDYIWGCKTYRETHEDLPADFKFEDIKLPEYEGDLLSRKRHAQFANDIESMANALDVKSAKSEEELRHQVSKAMGDEIEEPPVVQLADEDVAQITAPIAEEQPVVQPAAPQVPVQPVAQTTPVAPPNPAAVKKDIAAEMTNVASLFDEPVKKPATENKKFGEKKDDLTLPMLSIVSDTPSANATNPNKPAKTPTFDTTSTLLPGVSPVVQKKEEPKGPSITGQARPISEMENKGPKWKDPNATQLPGLPLVNDEKDEKKDEELKKPDLIIDDIDSLFQ